MTIDDPHGPENGHLERDDLEGLETSQVADQLFMHSMLRRLFRDDREALEQRFEHPRVVVGVVSGEFAIDLDHGVQAKGQ